MKDLIKKTSGSVKLFIIVALIYLIFGILNPPAITKAFNTFLKISWGVIPVLLIVFFLMFITNMFVNAKKFTKELEHKAGIKNYILAILLGILSAGPIYMWYPLLADMKEHGVHDSLIAIFLYNRAVKIPLLPMMIYYFGTPYVIILSCLMIVASVINGLIIDKILITQK
ncbi:hypothetical protein J7J83_02800 [bacterium]|nr:hypothetical protein [bacterium]